MPITIEVPPRVAAGLVERAADAGVGVERFAADAVVAGVDARDRGGVTPALGDALAEAEFNEMTWRLVHDGDRRAFALDDRPAGLVLTLTLPAAAERRLMEQAGEEERPAAHLAAASVMIAATDPAVVPVRAGA